MTRPDQPEVTGRPGYPAESGKPDRPEPVQRLFDRVAVAFPQLADVYLPLLDRTVANFREVEEYRLRGTPRRGEPPAVTLDLDLLDSLPDELIDFQPGTERGIVAELRETVATGVRKSWWEKKAVQEQKTPLVVETVYVHVNDKIEETLPQEPVKVEKRKGRKGVEGHGTSVPADTGEADTRAVHEKIAHEETVREERARLEAVKRQQKAEEAEAKRRERERFLALPLVDATNKTHTTADGKVYASIKTAGRLIGTTPGTLKKVINAASDTLTMRRSRGTTFPGYNVDQLRDLLALHREALARQRVEERAVRVQQRPIRAFRVRRDPEAQEQFLALPLLDPETKTHVLPGGDIVATMSQAASILSTTTRILRKVSGEALEIPVRTEAGRTYVSYRLSELQELLTARRAEQRRELKKQQRASAEKKAARKAFIAQRKAEKANLWRAKEEAWSQILSQRESTKKAKDAERETLLTLPLLDPTTKLATSSSGDIITTLRNAASILQVSRTTLSKIVDKAEPVQIRVRNRRYTGYKLSDLRTLLDERKAARPIRPSTLKKDEQRARVLARKTAREAKDRVAAEMKARILHLPLIDEKTRSYTDDDGEVWATAPGASRILGISLGVLRPLLTEAQSSEARTHNERVYDTYKASDLLSLHRKVLEKREREAADTRKKKEARQAVIAERQRERTQVKNLAARKQAEREAELASIPLLDPQSGTYTAPDGKIYATASRAFRLLHTSKNVLREVLASATGINVRTRRNTEYQAYDLSDLQTLLEQYRKNKKKQHRPRTKDASKPKSKEIVRKKSVIKKRRSVEKNREPLSASDGNGVDANRGVDWEALPPDVRLELIKDKARDAIAAGARLTRSSLTGKGFSYLEVLAVRHVHGSLSGLRKMLDVEDTVRVKKGNYATVEDPDSLIRDEVEAFIREHGNFSESKAVNLGYGYLVTGITNHYKKRETGKPGTIAQVLSDLGHRPNRENDWTDEKMVEMGLPLWLGLQEGQKFSSNTLRQVKGLRNQVFMKYPGGYNAYLAKLQQLAIERQS